MATTVSDLQPFTAIWCSPSYRARRTLITWTLPEQYWPGRVYVYRSLTGASPWECLNPTAPVSAAGNFEDEALIVDNRAQLVYYRLMLELDEVRYRSPSVYLLQALTRSQYGAARKIMIEELRRMRSGNGLQVYHVPLAPGEVSGVDLRTGQTTVAPCPNDVISGFGTPVLTWVELGQQQIIIQDRPEGDGNDTQVACPARMLSFPRPLRGHVIVDPVSDNRYAVDKVTEPHKFRGIVPTSYNVTLHLRPRDDPRYSISVPSIL